MRLVEDLQEAVLPPVEVDRYFVVQLVVLEQAQQVVVDTS